jgi:outer membrane receptor protein involved in Fe transport
MERILRSRPIAILLGLMCVFSPSATAQTESGTISGRVVDSSGSGVPGAEVLLTNQATGTAQKVAPEPSGDFIFTSVLPGVYSVSVRANGFKLFRERGLTLTASERLSTGNLTLEVGSLSESITVTADITPVQSVSAERSGLVSGQQTAQLLTVGRDLTSLVRILPGVVGDQGSAGLGTFPIPTINGVRNEYKTATIDGVIGNTRGYNNLDTPPNLDAIAEVKVLQGNYHAEYGKAMGSVVNIVTKSGTRQFHGTAYYYVRNEDFNANNFFDNLNGLPRPSYRYSTIGGNFGGPVYWPGKFNRDKNKLFAFFSQEYLPNKAPDGIKYYTVPTDLQRQGDFSRTFDTRGKLIYIRDPQAVGACSPSSGGPAGFPNNVMPQARINQVTKGLLGIFPKPNFTNTAISGFNYNYVTNTSANRPTYQSILRVDYNISDKWRMFFRGLNMVVNDEGYNSPANAAPWLAPANYKTHNPNAVVNVVWTATPMLLNELTLGTAFWTEDQILSAESLKLLEKSNYGLTLGQLYPQFNPLGLIPQMSFGGVPNAAGGGPNGRFPLEDVVSNYSVTDSLTKVWNQHTLKFGVDVQLDEYLQKHTGRSFSRNFAFDRNANNPFDSNYAYSNALLGNFSKYSEINNRPDYRPRARTFEWYAQDQWRTTSKLTLDLGVRFTWGLPQTVQNGSNFIPGLYSPAQAPVLYFPATVNGQNVAVNPLTGLAGGIYPAMYIGLFVPGTGNVANGSTSVNTPGYPSGMVCGTGVLAAPRFGFAWDPLGDGKTAIRSGFGVFLNARARTGQAGDMVSNPPNIFTLSEYSGNVSTFLNAGTLLGPPSVGHCEPASPEMPGNAPAAPVIGPGTNNWSIALFKNVRIKEKMTFQLRVETYNTFNHTQFTGLNTTPRFDVNGKQVNSSFGQAITAANPRYMQFAVRMTF